MTQLVQRESLRVAAVLPCYRTREQILAVLSHIGPEIQRIYVVDDCCPEQTGQHVERHCYDPRVTVLRTPVNQGVGGATMLGYQSALRDACDIVVKLDGDGQMDAAEIGRLIAPILRGNADYTKGNRFFALEYLDRMPRIRLFGNAVLSFVNKVASGYWDVMDPTNGFTAIHRGALSLLPLSKIDRGYFFESDMLFRLNTIRAVVSEVPMVARYGTEQSSLRIGRVVREFPAKFLSRFFKRIFYNYVLRDFNVCSVELLTGLSLLLFGISFGGFHWYRSFETQLGTATGTIMLAVLPIIIGVQLLLAAVTHDVMNVPRQPLQRSLGGATGVARSDELLSQAANH